MTVVARDSSSLSSNADMDDMTMATTATDVSVMNQNPHSHTNDKIMNTTTPPTYMQSLMCGAASNCLCNTDTFHSHPIRNPLVDAFDFVIWAADFNFRINGTRENVEQCIYTYQHNQLIDNDQLSMMLPIDPTFLGFIEGPVTFRPTYKYDLNSSKYDTSHKQRVPAWTDRILYKECNKLQLLSYYSANDLKQSDHRPVYATFQCNIGKKRRRHRPGRRICDTDSLSVMTQGSAMSGLGSFFVDMDNIDPLWTGERHNEVCSIS